MTMEVCIFASGSKNYIHVAWTEEEVQLNMNVLQIKSR
jgi:hypothetical protein